jgi:hypothetical protein
MRRLRHRRRSRDVLLAVNRAQRAPFAGHAGSTPEARRWAKMSVLNNGERSSCPRRSPRLRRPKR